MHKVIPLFFLLANSTLIYSQQGEKPRVQIITTGGTIASRTDAPLVEGSKLIGAVPQLTQYADIEVEEFTRVGSSKMTPQLWLSLLKRISTILDEKPDLTCIIITHGTDSMEETAYFLNLTHRHIIPIILVGSMRSSNEVSADGPANLINAVRVGISAEAQGKGVMVVMNENIFAARDLLKAHNRKVNAFIPGEAGFLGIVDPKGVVFYRTPTARHTTSSLFEVENLDSLPEVDIVQDFTGFNPDILEYFLDRPTAGLVISSFAGGRTSHGFDQILTFTGEGKPIVIASSIKGGRIAGTDQEGSPVIIARDLPANKARILLMLALTQTKDPGKIQKLFAQY